MVMVICKVLESGFVTSKLKSVGDRLPIVMESLLLPKTDKK